MRTRIEAELTEIRTVDFEALMRLLAGIATFQRPDESGSAGHAFEELYREHGQPWGATPEDYGISFIRHAKGLRAQLTEELEQN